MFNMRSNLLLCLCILLKLLSCTTVAEEATESPDKNSESTDSTSEGTDTTTDGSETTTEGSDTYKGIDANKAEAIEANSVDIETTSEETTTNAVPVPEFDCRLRPLSYGLFYGVSKNAYAQAVECCSSKGMNIATLKSITHWENIRDAILVESFVYDPIGPASGIYVETDIDNLDGYYPRDFADTISRILNGSNEPQPNICAVVYLASAEDITLNITGVPCEYPHQYLCRDEAVFDRAICKKINYVSLVNSHFIFSKDKLQWHEARECCEIKGGLFFGTSGIKEKGDLFDSLISNGVMGLEDSFAIWSGGFRKQDTDSFMWSANYEEISHPFEKTEFCMKGVFFNNSVTFEPHPCERTMPFICRMRMTAPIRCATLEMREFRIRNSFRKYYYSEHHKLTWADAILCCRAKGLRLLSMISPQEGKMLARHAQRHPVYRDRHQGFYHGLWTSGRKRTSGEYEFVSVKTRIRLDYSGRHHFLKGPWNGTCLQYLIDTRNSYLLTYIPCKSKRAFVCENPQHVYMYKTMVLQDIGNKYFYSSTEMPWEDANHLCRSNEMRLLNLKDHEEKTAYSLILQAQPERHHSPEAGLWVEATQAKMPPVPEQETKRVFKSGAIAKAGSLPRDSANVINFLNDEEEPETLNTTTCNAIYSIGREMKYIDGLNCTEKRAFVCEKEDPMYGKCNKDQMKMVGSFIISLTEATWKEAKRCCYLARRSLITLKEEYRTSDSELYNLVMDQFNRPGLGFWTSGTGSIVPQKWIWAGSSQYNFIARNLFFHNYTYYDVPTLVPSLDMCLEAMVNPLKSVIVMNHAECDTPKQFICDTKEVEVPKSCANTQLERLESTRFYYSKKAVTWPQAQECCQLRGFHLAEILNEYTNNRLYYFLSQVTNDIHNTPDYGLWIGLTSHISNHSSFTWLMSRTIDTQAPSSFSNWNPPIKLPVDPEHACALAYLDLDKKTLYWKNVDCTMNVRFICESEIMEE